MAKEKGDDEVLVPPALRTRVMFLSNKLRDAKEEEIRIRRQVGQMILDIKADKSGRYGPDPMAYIHAVFGKRNSVRPMTHLAKDFNDDEFEELISYRHPITRCGLLWTHVSVLTRLNSADLAKEWGRRAVNEGWDTKRIAVEVTRIGGKKSRGGRPPSKAGTIIGELEAVVSASKTWINRADRCWLCDDDGLQQLYEREGVSAMLGKIDTRAMAAIEVLDAVVNRAIRLRTVIDGMTARKPRSR